MSLKPIICYTAGTPNGHKVHCLIEELKEMYGSSTGFACEYKAINMAANEQKQECE
jgi:glutathione S-transferase